VIPIKDIIPPRRRPKVAYAVLALAVLILAFRSLTGIESIHSATFVLLNAIFLWVFADNVEDRMGHARFALLYTLCGVAGALTRSLLTSTLTVSSLLASGAVAGVMGAYFVLYPGSRVLMLVPVPLTLIEVPAALFLAFFFLLHSPDGLPSLAETLGGFLVGAALGATLKRPFVWT
jgi:membrane associated rhomboid family serine protease